MTYYGYVPLGTEFQFRQNCEGLSPKSNYFLRMMKMSRKKLINLSLNSFNFQIQILSKYAIFQNFKIFNLPRNRFLLFCRSANSAWSFRHIYGSKTRRFEFKCQGKQSYLTGISSAEGANKPTLFICTQCISCEMCSSFVVNIYCTLFL